MKGKIFENLDVDGTKFVQIQLFAKYENHTVALNECLGAGVFLTENA